MWVEERISKSGEKSYRYSERYRCPFSNKLKKVCVTYSKNTRAAEKAAYTELQAKIQKAISVVLTDDKTLDELIDEYLQYKKPFIKPTTYHEYDHLQSLVTESFPDDILLCKLSSALIQKTINKLLEDYSYSYIKDFFSLIRQSLKYARRMEYIRSLEFLENIELQKPPKSVADVKKERTKFLSKEELIDLLQKIKAINPHVALICEFQSLTGLRIGELLALRPQDYDKKTKSIDVNGTLCSVGSLKNVENRLSPKNVYSIRTVTLDERANQIIKFFIALNRQRAFANYKFKNYNYIFVTDGGLPYDLRYINKVLKKANFHKPVSTHTFRHTHISLLAEANVPLKAIMERVGHNEPRTTLAVYTHVTNAMAEEVRLAINDIGKKISGQ